MNKALLFCSLLMLLTCPAFAQEFEIKKYDVNAKVDTASYAFEVKARLSLVNLSGPDLADKILLAGPDGKPKLTFYLNSKAKLSSVTLNGAPLTTSSREDRSGAQAISTDVTSSLAGRAEFDVEFTYTIPLFEKGAAGQGTSGSRNTGLLISALEAFATPDSFWIPVRHTSLSDHGADTAPYTLTVSAPAGLQIVTAGVRKSADTFEQPYAALPFFLAGDYEVFSAGTSADTSLPNAPKVELYAPRGLDEAGRQQAQRLAAEGARMIDYFTQYFGGMQGGTFRIVSTTARERDSAITGELISRGLSFAAPGMVTVSDSLFRRNVLDLGTIELLASAAARQWIDGRVLLRGRGTGFMRDALPVYLSAQYLGERFGAALRESIYERYRRAYAPVARGGDAPLLMQNPLDRGYTTSVYNKGALVWRLLERRLGKPAFDALVRQALDRQKLDVLTLSDWQGPLCQATRCGSLKNILLAQAQSAELRQELGNIFSQWIEDIVLPEFAVGQPQTTPTGVEATTTNFGTGDFTVDVEATTATGEKLRRTLLVKAGEFPTAKFPPGTQIKEIMVDPDHLYIQKDYNRNEFPRRPPSEDLFGQAMLHLSNWQTLSGIPPENQTEAQRKLSPAQELNAAEAKAREALKGEPDSATLQALLGRVLLAAKKNDEATRVFNSALKAEPVPLQAYGWSLLGLGELALQQNKAAEAAKSFREAAATDLDQVTLEAARDGALRAETAASQIKVPDEVKAFLQQFDAAILQGSSEAIMPLVEIGTLRRFALSLAIRKPGSWVSEPLRTETLDANRIAVDVRLRAKISDKEYTGRALYILSRTGGKTVLSEVPVFDVK